MPRSSTPSFSAAAATAGALMRNVNRAAASRPMASAMPMAMVVPDRDMPGISADAWPMPMANAPGIVSASSPFVRGPMRSTTSSSTAPMVRPAAATIGPRR